MSSIENVPISLIDENPHRQLGTYPTIDRKVETLARSFRDIGVWEGIIARKVNDRYQLAFGHHRLEAAKSIGLTELPIIIRNLTDEEMLKFMGRENGEDYSTEFLIMLNTWEGAVAFKSRGTARGSGKAVEIADILGWIVPEHREQKGSRQMNDTAKACAAAHALISGGYIARSDLEGLSVKSAKEIVQRAHSRMEQIEKTAKATQRPFKEKEAAKKHVAQGAKITAREVKGGNVAAKDIRSEVDVNAYKSAAASKTRDNPLFAVFGRALVAGLSKILASDANAEKLEQVAKAVGQVTMAEDEAVLRQLDFELGELGVRANGWKKRLIPTHEKVVGLRSLEKKDA